MKNHIWLFPNFINICQDLTCEKKRDGLGILNYSSDIFLTKICLN